MKKEYVADVIYGERLLISIEADKVELEDKPGIPHQ